MIQIEKNIIRDGYITGNTVIITTTNYGNQYVDTEGKILNYIVEKKGAPIKHKVMLYDGTTKYFTEDTEIKPKTN